MYLVKVGQGYQTRFNVVRGCGSQAVTINPEPFRNENVAYRWMLTHSRKIIADGCDNTAKRFAATAKNRDYNDEA